MHIYCVAFKILAFVRMMNVSILIRVIFIMMLFANTSKFKVFMTLTDLKKKYYQVMKHQFAIQAGVSLNVFAVAI